MVFQDYALFPHLSVAANVGFGLAGLAGSERRSRVGELLATVGLGGQGDRYPHELSGGQQQRVALARALAPRPQLILLDEPFSNLDVDLRERLSLEVRDILKSQGITAVLVTHDQHEAFAMADEVGVMAAGTIQQWDTPYRVYHQPANRFVADFVGQGVFLPGLVIDDRSVEVELGVLESRLPLECSQGCEACGKDCGVEVLLRPDDIIHDDRSDLLAEVRHKAFRGAEILYTLRLGSGVEVLSLVPSHHNHAIGEKNRHPARRRPRRGFQDADPSASRRMDSRSSSIDDSLARQRGAVSHPLKLALREPNGLLCAGGDLSAQRLIDAYQRGIFPWYASGEPILWWSPDPRMVLFPASSESRAPCAAACARAASR
jgi:iron(III) transport system ATP-binding protein